MTLLQQEPIKSVKPNKGFTLDYLDYNQREKIVKHLKAGKTLKCHHKNCGYFENEFSTLYEYNVHCHINHRKSPLHPELSLIQLVEELEPRGNPWEEDSCSVVSILDSNIKRFKTYRDVENGLNFLLSHFNQNRLFPRTITTNKLKGSQIEVLSKSETMSYFEESNFIDCRVNGFPSYTRYKEVQRYPPDFIFIDIDRSSFETDKQFENALSRTKRNIKEKLNGYPTINNSGNGYHIIQPVECPILEQIKQFEKYEGKFFLSQEFLRFAEYNLSNGKADTGHHPSFKSCQIRVPGSVNGKCLDNREKRLSGFKVKTIQKWNGYRPRITREFIEDFRTYLEQKITDQEQQVQENNNNINQKHHYNINNNYYEWIGKLLQNPIEDWRKRVIDLIFSPYLVNIKKLSYEESYKIIKDWLDKCDNLKKLDNYRNYRISYALKNTMNKQIGPMSREKIKTDPAYSQLHQILKEKEWTIIKLVKIVLYGVNK